MTKRFSFLLIILMTAACLGSDFADSLKGSWVLESGATPLGEVPMVDGHPLTMDLDGRTISGRAACNSYGGDYELSSNGGFRIREGLAVTEMACSPPEVMESEQRFLEALTQVDRVELVEGGLVMTGGDVRLEFVGSGS